MSIKGLLQKAAQLFLGFNGEIRYKGVGITLPMPEPIVNLKALIVAAEAGFPGTGTGPQKLAFVLPFAFQAMTMLFGQAKGDQAKAAAEKFASAIVDWMNVVKEDQVEAD